MVNVIGVSARDITGAAVACSSVVRADEQPVGADVLGLYSLPDGATAITVVVTPKTSSFWPTTITATIGGDGQIVPDAASAVLVAVTTVGVSGARLSTLSVEVSRFMDVTDVALALLDDVPTERIVNLPPDPPVVVPGYERSHFELIYGAWPPKAWDTVPQTGVNYIDAANPVVDNVLNFAVDDALVVDNENVVLRLAGADAPQLFTVSWPRSMKPTESSEPSPMLVYMRPGVGQEVPYGNYQAANLPPYPFNYDYVEFAQFQFLSYAGDPLGRDPAPKGVPYQVAKSGKSVVTVIPCNRVNFEFGKLIDSNAAQVILEEIQAFMFRRAGVSTLPKSIGHVAIGAFSSGNLWLTQILATPANRASTFLKDHVTDVFFFDPPSDAVDACVAAALSWAGSNPSRHIRLYSGGLHPSHAKLLGATPPNGLFITESADGRNTAAVLSIDSWSRTFVAMLGRPLRHPVLWGDLHQLIPSTMLTHAMAQFDP
jgi:hypothetical protein